MHFPAKLDKKVEQQLDTQAAADYEILYTQQHILKHLMRRMQVYKIEYRHTTSRRVLKYASSKV